MPEHYLSRVLVSLVRGVIWHLFFSTKVKLSEIKPSLGPIWPHQPTNRAYEQNFLKYEWMSLFFVILIYIDVHGIFLTVGQKAKYQIVNLKQTSGYSI